MRRENDRRATSVTSPENKPKKPVSRVMRALMLGIPATVLLFSLVVLLRASLLGSQEGAALPPTAEPAAAASAPQAELSPAQAHGLQLKAFSSAADLYVVLSVGLCLAGILFGKRVARLFS